VTVSSLPVPRRRLAARGAIGLGTAVRAVPSRLLSSVRTAPVTWSLAALLAAIGVLEHAVMGQVHGGRPIGLLSLGALPNIATPGRGGSTDWWRCVSSAFLSSSLLHLTLTTVGLLLVGTHTERLYGRLSTLAVFLLTAAASGAIWVTASTAGLVPLGDYTMGASGGICGLIALQVTFGRLPHNRGDRRLAKAGATRGLLATGLLVITGFVLPGVNNVAHAAGLVFGVLVGAHVPPLPVHGGRRLRRVERVLMALVVVTALVALGFAAQHLVVRLLQPGP
jgi:membrane associated rhomboid family serine protease